MLFGIMKLKLDYKLQVDVLSFGWNILLITNYIT